MEIKNYKWNGFGFPVIFESLPAIEIRGELVPDVDFSIFAKSLIQFICKEQSVPLSGSQIKFIRNHLGMSLREFGKFLKVKHQSVMRWENKKQAAAKIDVYTEIVMRQLILKELDSGNAAIVRVIENVAQDEKFEAAGNYKQFRPLKVPETFVQAAM